LSKSFHKQTIHNNVKFIWIILCGFQTTHDHVQKSSWEVQAAVGRI
jgi:hypothetical protein